MDLKISRIGVVAKPQSPLAAKAIARVMEWGSSNGVEVLMDRTSAKLMKGEGLEHSRLMAAIDALVVLGGDGTFLNAARMATSCAVPLLGVNLGSLGFITEVAFDEIERALNELKDGDYVMEERLMLDLKVENDRQTRTELALNDVVLSRKSMAKMIELSVMVNGEHVTHYKADGLIIATPTGSTAYALSAGGPILYPVLEALVVCPICPHTLSNRPIVIPADATIELDLTKGQEEVIATLDGQICIDVNEYDHLTLKRSKNNTKLIKVPDRTHYDTLRSKLGWGGS